MTVVVLTLPLVRVAGPGVTRTVVPNALAEQRIDWKIVEEGGRLLS
ncbi:hypothetical protein [Burkholderia stagnalis]|nr:hypothetical protein [Burkholderia stagnalis]